MELGLFYAATSVVLFMLDGAWRGVVARQFYAAQLGTLNRSPVDLTPRAALYVLYAIGLTTLAVQPGLREGNVVGAIWRGALLGLTAFGTYDLMNLSGTANWPPLLALIDLAWGTALTVATATAAFYIGRALGVV